MWNCDGWLTGGYPGAGNFPFGVGTFGGIMGLLIIIVLLVLLYKLFKALTPGTNAASDKNDSFMILKSRFARGEISLDEYQRMKGVLLHQ
jgi:putative membrane protein